ncbi:MAG TPA: hypothetical protein VM554_12870 [Acidisarcina sp.]|nr:hypothetical protein [Acidisarcina sp.]
MNLQFGSGVLFGNPNAGNTATNPTPQRFGILQEVQVEFKADLKKLYGQNQFAAAKARGKIDVTCKGKIATLDPTMMNQLYFGLASAAGVQRIVDLESHVPAATIAPTKAVAGSLLTDYGVINKDTGLNMIRVATAPLVGQYTFVQATTGGTPTAASYTFNAAETASAVLLSYLYSDATNGVTINLTSQLMGYAPEFSALLYNVFRTKYFALQLNSCTMGSISIPTKQEDFWMADITFDASADVTGAVGAIYADVN